MSITRARVGVGKTHLAVLAVAFSACGTEPQTPLLLSEHADASVDAGIEIEGAAHDAGGEDAGDLDPRIPSISRFAPHQGLIGTHVRILGDLSEYPLENVVTIGGVRAIEVNVPHVLEVEVAPGTSTGQLCVTVRSRTSCGERFTVLTGPLLYNVSPSHVFVGARQQVLLATGDGFTPTSEVHLDGIPLPTTFLSATQLEATVPATFFSEARIAKFSVLTPGAQAASYPVIFTVMNPGPGIASLEPSTVPAATSAVVSIVGDHFVSTSVAQVDGLDVATTATSSSTLTIRLPATFSSGAHVVTVRNPPPGGGTSAPGLLTID